MKTFTKLLVVTGALFVAAVTQAQFLYQEDGTHTLSLSRGQPIHSGYFTNSTVSVIGGTLVTATNRIVPLKAKSGIMLSASVVSTNPLAFTSGTLYFDLGVDGQAGNLFTASPTGFLALPFTLNGTNAVNVASNYSATVIGNSDWSKWTSITNAGPTSNRVDVGFVRWQYSDP